MAVPLGNDRRLWIESATPGTYNMIKGNTTLRRTRGGSTFSTGSKDDFPYDPQAAGSRTMSIAATFRPKLPDVNGFDRFWTLATGATSTPIKVQIRKGAAAGADPADVLFDGAVYVTDLPDSADQNAAVEVSCTLVIAEPPTIDKIN